MRWAQFTRSATDADSHECSSGFLEFVNPAEWRLNAERNTEVAERPQIVEEPVMNGTSGTENGIDE